MHTETDRRSSRRRQPVRMSIVIHAAGSRLVSGWVRDLDKHGMYVETDLAVRAGEMLRIGFMAGGEMQIVQGVVSRPEDGGFAFSFTESNTPLHPAIGGHAHTETAAPALA